MTDRAYSVKATRRDEPARWVQLTLSLRDGDDGLGHLAHAAMMTCAVEPLDERSRTYSLENWESGLLSGYFYICRRAKRMPPPPILLSELQGSLKAEDMEGIVKAAESASAHLFDRPELAPSSVEWTVAITPLVPVAQD